MIFVCNFTILVLLKVVVGESCEHSRTSSVCIIFWLFICYHAFVNNMIIFADDF